MVLLTGLLIIFWGFPLFASAPKPLPRCIVANSVEVVEYDAHTLRDPRPEENPPFNGYPDDLLSGGLNLEGLQSSTPPPFATPETPTPTELRRLTIYTNYRAIVDMTTEGGYGLFWGPSLAPDFGPQVPSGLIPGVEYTAVMKISSKSPHSNTVPVAVQIPDHFDLNNPCIFLVPPSSSRGFYGGVAIAEWGLFKGCAVVMPGKGTGTGFHLLTENSVYESNGVLTDGDQASGKVQFSVKKNRALKKYCDRNPYRVAVKHAHSQINCERLWGDLALNGIEFALWVLNDWFGQIMATDAEEIQQENYYAENKNFTASNTLVIASGTSNGAAASLHALEKDRGRTIDGLVVIEPNITPNSKGKFSIIVGQETFETHGTTLFDYSTLMGVFAPCAALSPELQNTPYNLDPIGAPENARINRCKALHARGLLQSHTIEKQAEEALTILRAHGYTREQETLLAGHEWLNLWRSLNPTYAAAYGRFAVWDPPGGISFGATDSETGAPTPLKNSEAVILSAVSNGIPPTGGINLINDAAHNGPILENLSISPTSGTEDLNLDGALYFRYLATGDPELIDGGPRRKDRRYHQQVQRGIREVLSTANLHGTPAILLTGRSDSLVFPNYHARPYFGLNQMVEGEKSRLRYIEVTHAQHFDAFISSFWLNPVTHAVQFVPLHYYLIQSLDWMYAYLKKEKTDLPPSQIVRPQPRELDAYTFGDADARLLPKISVEPDADDLIRFEENKLIIPR